MYFCNPRVSDMALFSIDIQIWLKLQLPRRNSRHKSLWRPRQTKRLLEIVVKKQVTKQFKLLHNILLNFV